MTSRRGVSTVPATVLLSARRYGIEPRMTIALSDALHRATLRSQANFSLSSQTSCNFIHRDVIERFIIKRCASMDARGEGRNVIKIIIAFILS